MAAITAIRWRQVRTELSGGKSTTLVVASSELMPCGARDYLALGKHFKLQVLMGSTWTDVGLVDVDGNPI